MSEHDFLSRRAMPVLPAAGISATTLLRSSEHAESGGTTCKLGDASCSAAHAGAISRRAAGGESSLNRSLLQLQRDYGNQFVGQVLRHGDGSAGDHGGGGMDVIERAIESARGGGQPMDHSTRSRMESSFGTDFSDVRIHTDTRADGLSQSLAARAFTTGQDVFFRQGEYSPGTTVGRELLAHELTHVVQQTGGVQRKMTVSQPGDAHELEADQMARQVIAQEHLQRQPEAPSPTEEDEKKLGRSPADIARQQEEERR